MTKTSTDKTCSCPNCSSASCGCQGGGAAPKPGECCCGPVCKCGDSCACPASCGCGTTSKK